MTQHTPPTDANATDANANMGTLDGAPTIPAPDPKSPVGRALAALVSALTDATKSATSETDAKRDAQILALTPLAGDPIIDETILRIQRERELDTVNARKHAAFLLRKQYSEAFAILASYGLPEVVAPAKSTKSGASKLPTGDIRDADGVLYRKEQSPRASYTLTGAVACGACEISAVVGQAGAIALPNFRQNSTKALAKMTGADVNAHAACFEALRDAEYDAYPHAATVCSYTRA